MWSYASSDNQATFQVDMARHAEVSIKIVYKNKDTILRNQFLLPFLSLTIYHHKFLPFFSLPSILSFSRVMVPVVLMLLLLYQTLLLLPIVGLVLLTR